MAQFTNGTIRERRQSGGIPVASSGLANANGSNTDLSSSNAMWRNTNGTVGANGTSSGNAAGTGPSNVMSQSNAMAGPNSASNNGNVNAAGTNSRTSGMSASTSNARGRAGATGNIYSGVDLSVGQTLNWGQVMFSLSAISTAMALSANGLVSGVNDNGGGNVYSHVSANGTGNGNSSQMAGEMVGGINSKTGGSRLVGAESLTNSGSSSNVNSFANIVMNGSGASEGGLWGNSSINPAGSVNGLVGAQGKSSGANKTVTVDDGVRGVNSNGAISGGIGRGNIEGSGNQDGAASSYVGANAGYPQSGVVVGSSGESKAMNGTPSILSINDQGNLLNGTGMGANGTNSVNGRVTGQSSSVNGNTFMGLGQTGNSGNSSVVAKGGGAGPSSANTNANLQMVGANGVPQFENIRGSVDATGDNTNVSSLSQLSNTNGLQSLFNNQKSDVQSKGAGQASSSNSAMLKRKKRNEEEILKINLERKARSAEENNSLRQLLEKNGNEQIVAYI
uniref:BZIP domain-containing protein n=1 Tax=Meloidogyne hapla TaxID=6305 RepID=A0A1I8BSV1_MELHA